MIYLESDMFEKFQEEERKGMDHFSDVVYLSDEQIKKELETDNKKFLESIEKYNQTNDARRVVTFITSFENKNAEALSHAQEGC